MGNATSGLYRVTKERDNLDLANLQTLKALMAKHGIRPLHKLGQNFLTDVQILDRIVQASGVGPGDLVIEIGPGMGGLTQRLAQRAGRVLAIELDRKLVDFLSKTVQLDYPNVEILQGDAVRIDLHALLAERLAPGQKATVAANLPYYVTTPLVMRLLEEDLPLDRVVVMVQKEVADRMVSPPGSKEYGALSVAVQYHTEPEIITLVSPDAFVPSPDVTSAVVAMRLRSTPPVDVDRETFFRVVRAAFGQRRKTLGNALGAGLQLDKPIMLDVLSTAGIDPGRRGETLSQEEFARIAESVRVHFSQSPQQEPVTGKI